MQHDALASDAVPGRVAPFRDPLFLAALALGPLVWLALVALGQPRPPGMPGWRTFAFGVLLYPLLEEYVFRGLLQGALLERAALTHRRLGISGANALTSLAFATAHLISQSPLHAASVLAPSLVFGWLRERHGTLLSPMLAHAFYNAGYLWLFAAG